MIDRSVERLQDISRTIGHIRDLLANKTAEDLDTDVVALAAFERFLEIISEASRHLPEEWKQTGPSIPWRRVADLGNQLRHAYHRIDRDVLWSIYENDLPPLEQAICRLLSERGR